MICLSLQMQAQTMRWISIPPQSDLGNCKDQSSKSGLTQCYVLEYTPKVSGVLTSYTTGFFVSCTSLGSPIVRNQCCGMSPKNNEVNGCNAIGKILLNSSGNSGTINNNQVTAGVPVILHQICLAIPLGEQVTIEEEPVTDLTTSIDLGNGTFVTEYPDFEIAKFKRLRYDADQHMPFLDFQGEQAGDRVSKLDWTIPGGDENIYFIVERSVDGEQFYPIGELNGKADDVQIRSYQFFDKEASWGSNFYRLRKQDPDGKEMLSPVRKISFSQFPFEVSATPNPAKEKLFISFSNAAEAGTASLLDASGKVRAAKDFNLNQSSFVFELDAFEAGIFTLQVKSGDDVYIEKIVIIR